jgi:flagellar basal-body rod modification protein FlgD
MSTTNALSGVQGQQGQQASTSNSFNKVDLNAFLKMLVAELQNQDPLSPMDNSQILQQVSQIKSIESNQRLSDTLGAMQQPQDIVAASTLLQKTITGLTDQGDKVTGKVDRVTIDDKGVKVCIGDNTISLKNVAEINPAQ